MTAEFYREAAAACKPDPDAVCRFVNIIVAQAERATHGLPERGLLQTCSRAPDGETAFARKRFRFDQIEDVIAHTLRRNGAEGRNVFFEARTLQPNAPLRGKMEETAWCWALVIDADGDRGKGWKDNVGASLVIETSANNFQFWFFLRTALLWEAARPIGDAMRRVTRADTPTGVVCQPYRTGGGINFPGASKRARGRVPTPTRIVSHSGELWTPRELRAAFPMRKVMTPTVQREPLRRAAASELTSAEILERYPHIKGPLREQLLSGGGPLGNENKSDARWKWGRCLRERKVAGEDAYVLLVNSNWCPPEDAGDAARIVRKMWGIEIE